MTADEMRAILRKEICEVVFTKKDGSERNMACTLLPSILDLPMQEAELVMNKAAKDPSQTHVTVWDIDIDDWRSFKVDSVKSFEVITE